MKCEESLRLALHCTGVAHGSCSWTTTLQQLRTKHERTGLAGARRMLEVTAPETTASSRSATLATSEPWGKNWPQPCVLALALRNYLQCGATTIVPDTSRSYNATYCLTNPTTVLFHPVSWSLSHVTSCFGVRTAHSNNKWSLVLW